MGLCARNQREKLLTSLQLHYLEPRGRMSAVPTSWENDNLIGAQRNDTEGHQHKNKPPNLSEEGRQTSKETNNHETSRTVFTERWKDNQTKRNIDITKNQRPLLDGVDLEKTKTTTKNQDKQDKFRTIELQKTTQRNFLFRHLQFSNHRRKNSSKK